MCFTTFLFYFLQGLKGFLSQDIQAGSLQPAKRDLVAVGSSGIEDNQSRKKKTPLNTAHVSTPIERPSYLCDTSMNTRGTGGQRIATPKIVAKNPENIYVVGFIVLPHNVFQNNTLKVSSYSS